MSLKKWEISGVVALRVALGVFVVSQTFFCPDEYYQSLEVAHEMVYGYGHLTWEWWGNVSLRSALHPSLFAVPFHFLKVLGADTPQMVLVTPLVVQGVMAGAGDIATFHLTLKLTDNRGAAAWGLFVCFCSWFYSFCCVRTLSNSLEAVLVTVAMCFYDWEPGKKGKGGRSLLFLCLAGVSVCVRPTACLPLIPLALYQLYIMPGFWGKLLFLVKGVVIGGVVVGASVAIDSWYYGRLTFVLLNFLKFNVLGIGGGAGFYGTHPPHWYLSQGIPVVYGPLLPLFLFGCYSTWKGGERGGRLVLFPIVFTVGVLSCLGHKEFRFLLPILPLSFVLIARVLFSLFGEFGGVVAGKGKRKRRRKARKENRIIKVVVGVLLFLNLPMFVYFSCLHQSGPISVLQHLRNLPPSSLKEGTDFLMPCHSVPMYSHLHQPFPIHVLECPPPLVSQGYDQAYDFYANPSQFLERFYSRAPPSSSPTFSQHYHKPLPYRIAFYDSLYPVIADFLSENGFLLERSFFHSLTPVEGRHGRSILLFSRTQKPITQQ